jgi:hypothetical protein
MSGDTGETQSADLRWVLSELASGTPVGSIELTGRLSEASQAAELRSRLTLGQAQAALSGPDFDVLAVEAGPRTSSPLIFGAGTIASGDLGRWSIQDMEAESGGSTSPRGRAT